MIWIDKNNKISDLKRLIEINQKELDEIIKVKEEKKQKLIDMIDLYLKSINLKKIKEEDYILFKRLTWLDWKTEKDKFIYVILIEKNELIDIHIKEIRISNNITKFEKIIIEYEKTKFDRWTAIGWTILWIVNVWWICILIFLHFFENIYVFLMMCLFTLIIIIYIPFILLYNRTKEELQNNISLIQDHKEQELKRRVLEYERVKKREWNKKDIIYDIQNINDIIRDPNKYYDYYHRNQEDYETNHEEFY